LGDAGRFDIQKKRKIENEKMKNFPLT